MILISSFALLKLFVMIFLSRLNFPGRELSVENRFFISLFDVAVPR